MAVDFSRVRGGMSKLESQATGLRLANAAMRAMDRWVRKDTLALSGSARPSAWHVLYPKPYAKRVWFPGTRIVSPRNKRARYEPHAQPETVEYVRKEAAKAAREAFRG